LGRNFWLFNNLFDDFFLSAITFFLFSTQQEKCGSTAPCGKNKNNDGNIDDEFFLTAAFSFFGLLTTFELQVLFFSHILVSPI